MSIYVCSCSLMVVGVPVKFPVKSELAPNVFVEDVGWITKSEFEKERDSNPRLGLAHPWTFSNVHTVLLSWFHCPSKPIIVCCQLSALLSTLLSELGL